MNAEGLAVAESPHIIHLMHFPWDADQRLKADPEDFDKRHVCAMQRYADGFDVHLWTLPRVRELCEAHYPEVWRALEQVARPVMLVDVLRWVVVHYFGGIYWQMNTTPLVPMAAFLPAPGKHTRLFTEFDLTPEQCRSAASEPIRNGEPEEAKRILIQVFSALPGSPFVRSVIAFLLERVKALNPVRDYDILYITGNAAVSTAYDRFGKSDDGVELTDRATALQLMKWHYRGSWRVDAGAVENRQPVPQFPQASRWDGLRAICRRVVGNPADPPSVRMPDHVRESLRVWMHGMGLGRLCERTPSDPVHSKPPAADVVAVFDELEWRSDGEVMQILAQAIRSRARYLALSHHPLVCDWWSSATGDYRPMAFTRPPFNFPPPIFTIPCPHPERRVDRELAIWPVSSLRPLVPA